MIMKDKDIKSKSSGGFCLLINNCYKLPSCNVSNVMDAWTAENFYEKNIIENNMMVALVLQTTA